MVLRQMENQELQRKIRALAVPDLSASPVVRSQLLEDDVTHLGKVKIAEAVRPVPMAELAG